MNASRRFNLLEVIEAATFNTPTLQYLDMVDLRLKNFDCNNVTLYNLALEGEIEVPNIPLHSVNNEKAIKVTSQASLVAMAIS